MIARFINIGGIVDHHRLYSTPPPHNSRGNNIVNTKAQGKKTMSIIIESNNI